MAWWHGLAEEQQLTWFKTWRIEWDGERWLPLLAWQLSDDHLSKALKTNKLKFILKKVTSNFIKKQNTQMLPTYRYYQQAVVTSTLLGVMITLKHLFSIPWCPAAQPCHLSCSGTSSASLHAPSPRLTSSWKICGSQGELHHLCQNDRPESKKIVIICMLRLEISWTGCWCQPHLFSKLLFCSQCQVVYA